MDLSRPLAFPHIFPESLSRILDEKTEKKDKENIKEKILSLIEDLWRFYDKLSKHAAEKESFLIHFIDSNIFHIAMNLLQIQETDVFDEEERSEVLNEINWLISVYWRVYDYHAKITKNYEMQLLENLLNFGYELNKRSLNDLVKKVISYFISIGENFMEKKEGAYPRELLDIILKPIYLSIINGSEDIRIKLVKRLKDKFWPRYCQKFKGFPGQMDLLFNELEDLDPDSLKMNRPHLSFEHELISKLEKENIQKFSIKLRSELKL